MVSWAVPKIVITFAESWRRTKKRTRPFDRGSRYHEGVLEAQAIASACRPRAFFSALDRIGQLTWMCCSGRVVFFSSLSSKSMRIIRKVLLRNDVFEIGFVGLRHSLVVFFLLLRRFAA